MLRTTNVQIDRNNIDKNKIDRIRDLTREYLKNYIDRGDLKSWIKGLIKI